MACKKVSSLVCIFLPLIACSNNSSGIETTQDFKWDAFDKTINCSGDLVRPMSLLMARQGELRQYLNVVELLPESEGFSSTNPANIGYKTYEGKHYFRYDFSIPTEDSKLTFDGGYTVVMEACSGSVIFAAPLGW